VDQSATAPSWGTPPSILTLMSVGAYSIFSDKPAGGQILP